MPRGRPRVVVLDDRVRDAETVKMHLRHSATVDALGKADLTAGSFARADLVLVDYDLEGWQTGAQAGATLLESYSGVGLGLNIIEFVESKQPTRAPLVVLLTGKLDLQGDFAPSLSQQIELDWVLSKKDPNLRKSLRALASWHRSRDEELPSIAGFGDDSWLDFLNVAKHKATRERVRWSLEGTERPIETKTRRAPARVIAAWVLQRLIGYPGPLWSSEYLYARLGLSPRKRQTERTRRGIEESFAACRYTGPLAEVEATRWWKVLVEGRLDELTKGASSDRTVTREVLAKQVRGIRFSSAQGPLVAIVEESGRPTGELAALADAVQVAPFGWPANADPAFMLWEDIRSEPDLRRLVAPFAARENGAADK
jgi:hypothetical protein